jgi:hypothetical protein
MNKFLEYTREIEDLFLNYTSAIIHPNEWANNEVYHLKNDMYCNMLDLKMFLETLLDNRERY